MLAVAVPALAHSGDPDDGKVETFEELAQDPDFLDERRAATEEMTSLECTEGFAGPFPCENVDLESFVPLELLGGPTGNDIWGWTDPATGDEYAIMGTANGTAFVDVTDPQNPEVEGFMPTQSTGAFFLWRDIKVFDDHAFVVSEQSNHGMQVFDLTRLRDEGNPTLGVANVLPADTVYFGDGSDPLSYAHNVSINTDTGFAYIIGSNTCEGGLHMVDVNEPQNPTFAGCFSEDGYTHDVECVIYAGPDSDHTGDEICFASNEDTVTVVDVTDKDAPELISRTGYPQAAYTHQGSLTADQAWFLFGDELDEQTFGVPTTTYIMDVSDLDAPPTPQPYRHDTTAIDHNLYFEDGYVFESNYTAGLRILDYSDESLAAGQLEEVAFFDVFPAGDPAEFLGTWSNYTFPTSDTVVVSTIDSGLFVLTPDLPEQDGDEPGPPGDGDQPPGDGPGKGKKGPGNGNGPGEGKDRPGPGDGRGGPKDG